MIQTHYSIPTLKGTERPDEEVKALFAVQSNPQHKLIIFVHGFNGSPETTWGDFQNLLPGSPTFTGSDILFYGYDGKYAQANSSAAIFRDFLDRLFGNIKAFLDDNLPPAAQQRADDFKYHELVIVAHSLGAVISRRTLLDATKAGSRWVTDTSLKLVLYAPAHKGSNAVEIAKELMSTSFLLRLIAACARSQSPLIDALQPESALLSNLLRETMMMTKGGKNLHLLATSVVFAEKDSVVENESFGDDPVPDSIPDTDHWSICKPTKDFKKPLEFLEGSITKVVQVKGMSFQQPANFENLLAVYYDGPLRQNSCRLKF